MIDPDARAAVVATVVLTRSLIAVVAVGVRRAAVIGVGNMARAVPVWMPMTMPMVVMVSAIVMTIVVMATSFMADVFGVAVTVMPMAGQRLVGCQCRA